jgi:glutamyl-tRNA reductase
MRFAFLRFEFAPGGFVEPALMVIGLNHRTAPLAMRERFWIGENRRYGVLRQLKSAEGIEEVVILSTCCRTEFLVWASEPTLAANSILQFLGAEHGLRLSEWQHFYRLLDDAALIHVFRVTSGLDSLALGEPQIVVQIRNAWEQARTVGAAGHFLNATVKEALNVAEQVRSTTALGKLSVSIPAAALQMAREIFGSLAGRRILLLGTAEISQLSARHLVQSGADSVVVIDQSLPKARQMAERLDGIAATLAERWKYMLRADIVISGTGCPHVVLTRDEAERIAEERNRVALLIIDVGTPRNVDPEVRRVDGILLYDLEGLERTQEITGAERIAATGEAEKTVNVEAQAFRSRLRQENTVPTIVALRLRLEEICRQELESFAQERGPFTVEQDQSLHAITAQIIQKIAGSVARELKELPEREEQERMTAAVTRLFHLQSPKAALAGTSWAGENNDGIKDHAVAI